MAKPRSKIPIKLRHKLFDQAQSACPNPKCAVVGVSALEIHHMDGDPTNNAEGNLVALCGSCHSLGEKQVISEADLALWKRMLVAGFHPRSGGQYPLPSASAGQGNFHIGVNRGQVQSAKKIVNNYRGKAKPSLAPAPDSIGAHAAERSYLEYLRKRYIKCRLTEQKYGDKRRFKPEQASNTIAKAIGYMPLQAPLSSFEGTWRAVHRVVCSTLGATKYLRGYRPKTWDEHQAMLLRGESPED